MDNKLIFDECLLIKEDLNKYFENNDEIKTISMGKQEFVSEQLITCDPGWIDPTYNEIFINKIPTGTYEIIGSTKKINTDYLLAVKIKVREEISKKYYLGIYLESDIDAVKDDKVITFGVDNGAACFLDKTTYDKLYNLRKKDYDKFDDSIYFESMYNEVSLDGIGEFIEFQSGFGDGHYSTYFGYNDNNELCDVVIKFIDYDNQIPVKEKKIDTSVLSTTPLLESYKDEVKERYINNGYKINEDLKNEIICFENSNSKYRYMNKLKISNGHIELTDYSLYGDNPDNAFGIKLGMTLEEAKEQLFARNFNIENDNDDVIVFIKYSTKIQLTCLENKVIKINPMIKGADKY